MRAIFSVRAIGVFLILVTLAVTACQPVQPPVQPQAPPPTPTQERYQVRFGVDSFILGAQIDVAAAKGFFEKHGVDAELQTFSFGVDTVDAVLADRTHFGVVIDFAGLTRAPADQFRIVAIIMEPEPGFHKLAVRGDINGPEDLRGKRLGVARSTVQEYITNRYLEINGVPPESAEMVEFTSLFEIVAALRSGQIDAAWVWADGPKQLADVEEIRILTDDAAAKHQTLGYIVVDKDFLQDNPKAVEASLAALVEATDWLIENMEEGAEIVSKRTGAAPEDVLPVMKLEHYQITLQKRQIEMLKNLAKFMTERNIVDKPIDVDKLVDPAPLRKVAPDRVDL